MLNSGFFVNLKMDRIFRSNSSISSQPSIPPDIPDIINEENYSVEEESCLDFNKWTIPKINVNAIYKTSSILLLKLNLMLRPSNGLMPYLEFMRNVVCLTRNLFMMFLLKDIDSYILDLFKLLLSH